MNMTINNTNPMASDKPPVEAVTAIDGSDKHPQWVEESGINRKSSSKRVHSEEQTSRRGKGGKMGKQWN